MRLDVKCPFPPGLVVIISGDLSRYSEFETSLIDLLVPMNSDWTRLKGNSIAFSRNKSLMQSLEPKHKWVWFIDDDHTFEPEILMWLLNRNVDIVQPMVTSRKPPYVGMAQRDNSNGDSRVIPLSEMKQGLLEVDAVGCGGMLIKREVLDAVGDMPFQVGQIDRDQLQEDLFFCRQARRLGFKVYVDCDFVMGHMDTHGVVPVFEDGQWRVHIDLGYGVGVRLPESAGDGLALEM